MGWFAFIVFLGLVMRCWLCCNTMISGNLSIQSLYNSFVDDDEAFENETEGIALDSISSSSNDEHDEYRDNETGGSAADSIGTRGNNEHDE